MGEAPKSSGVARAGSGLDSISRACAQCWECAMKGGHTIRTSMSPFRQSTNISRNIVGVVEVREVRMGIPSIDM